MGPTMMSAMIMAGVRPASPEMIEAEPERRLPPQEPRKLSEVPGAFRPPCQSHAINPGPADR
ncbi:hypothetical protein FQZ97_391810 [compost metagenome]